MSSFAKKKGTRHQRCSQGLSSETPWERGRYCKEDAEIFLERRLDCVSFKKWFSGQEKRAGLVNLSSARREAVVLTVATQHVVLKLENTQF